MQRLAKALPCRRKSGRAHRVKRHHEEDEEESQSSASDEPEDPSKRCLSRLFVRCCGRTHHRHHHHYGKRAARTAQDDFRLRCSKGELRKAQQDLRRSGADNPGSTGAITAASATASGYTALHAAAAKGHKQVVELLLEQGVEVNCATHGKITPLMLAASGGHAAVAELLLQRGADVAMKAKSARGTRRAHEFADGFGHHELAETLLKALPKEEQRTERRRSAADAQRSDSHSKRSASSSAASSGSKGSKGSKASSSAAPGGAPGVRHRSSSASSGEDVAGPAPTRRRTSSASSGEDDLVGPRGTSTTSVSNMESEPSYQMVTSTTLGASTGRKSAAGTSASSSPGRRGSAATRRSTTNGSAPAAGRDARQAPIPEE